MGVVGLNEGTTKFVATDTVGTTQYQWIKMDIGTVGVSNPFSGTLPSIQNLQAGTITALANGTLGAGTLNTLGTVANVNNGSIVVTTGTIASIPNTPGGTLGLITRVGNVGTLEVGTVASLPNIPGGSISVIAGTGIVTNGSIVVTVGTITTGTIVNSGTTTGVGSVSNIGSIGMLNAATISTMPNIPGGTVGLVTRVGNVGTLEVGTVSSLPNIPGGTIGVVSSLTNGTVATNILPLGGVVLTTPTAVGSAGTAFPLPATALSNRKSLICYNVGTTTVYIGGGTVTTAAGIPIGTGAYSPSLDIGTTILYGIVPANQLGGTLVVMEVS